MSSPTIAGLLAQANLDERTLGLQLEHHQDPDGTWRSTLPTSDLVLLLDLALNPSPERAADQCALAGTTTTVRRRLDPPADRSPSAPSLARPETTA